MVEQAAKTTESTIALKRTANAAGIPVFYINNSTIYINQWDAQFVFSLIHETSPGQFGSVDQVSIIMTPEHALTFLKALENAIEGFQKGQGPIRVIPPSGPMPIAQAEKK